MWELDRKESWVPENWCFWTVVLEKTLESPLDCKIKPSPSGRKSVLNIHWKDWCWSCNTLATWCKEVTQWKASPWCWKRLKAGGEGDNRGWDGWMASPTQWTWVWASSGSWWWTGKNGVLQSMGFQRVGHDWATELNWTHLELSWEESRSVAVVVADSLSHVRLCDSMDCSPPGSSVHGIFQARILEWIAISFSRESYQTQELNLGLLHCRQILYWLSNEGSPEV